MDLSDMSTKEVLRSYSSVKGHRTQVEREIASLLKLLHPQYSATSELRLNDHLEKLEKHTHKLIDISKYLICIKYLKARDQGIHGKPLRSAPRTFLQCSMKDMRLLAPLLLLSNFAPDGSPAWQLPSSSSASTVSASTRAGPFYLPTNLSLIHI